MSSQRCHSQAQLYDITVISKRNFFLYTPLLPTCTMGSIEAGSAWLSSVQNTELRKRRYLYLLDVYRLLGIMWLCMRFPPLCRHTILCTEPIMRHWNHVCRHLEIFFGISPDSPSSHPARNDLS